MKSIRDPCKSIVPPLLSALSGTVFSFQSGAVSPLLSGTFTAPALPSVEGCTSKVPDVPETSSTAPALATMLPESKMVPPGKIVPCLRL